MHVKACSPVVYTLFTQMKRWKNKPTQSRHESVKYQSVTLKTSCENSAHWPNPDPSQVSGFLLQFCIKFTKACVGLLPSTLRCGESQNSCLCFLSSQHFVPLANVTAFKGVEKTREIYTVNHFCAETAEEGLSLACKHRRLCAAAAKKKLIYMCPPHSVFTALPLSLGFHPRDLSWRRCQRRLWSLMLYPTGRN